MDLYGRAIGDVAEAALQGETRELAWTRIMGILEATLGFDSGYVGTTPGPTASVQAAILGHEEAAFRKSLGPYLSHITPREIGEYLHRARRGTEVFSRRRRETMAAHYAPLSPRVVRDFVCRVSWCRGELIGISVERQHGTSDFGEKELEFMDAVWPLLQTVNLIHDGSLADGLLDFRDAWQLTQREGQVAELVVRGLQNAEIGALLGLSRNTVRNALVRIFAKARVSTRSELVFLAHQLPMPSVSAVGGSIGTDGLLAFATRVKTLAASQKPQTRPPSTQSSSGPGPFYAARSAEP
jgi:DNA-binding CsgD family transcriptional regulator